MTAIDYKIKNAVASMRNHEISDCQNILASLYGYMLSHVSELKEISLFQVTGSILAEFVYAKFPGFSRLPHIAYYCFTKGVSAPQPMGYYNIMVDNMNKSVEGRLKMMLKGGYKLVEQRLGSIRDIPSKQKADFYIMGDILKLQSIGYTNHERWWQWAVEDNEKVRNRYCDLSDETIINSCNNIHDRIAEMVLRDLQTYAEDYGFV